MTVTDNTLLILLEKGYADYHELVPFIDRVIELGKNEWGFQMRTIITIDGSKWSYIAEDNIYELSLDDRRAC